MADTTEKKFSFGNFELDGAKRLLLKNRTPVSLRARTFDLLRVLVENRGRVMTKDELLGMVWDGQFVEENNLSVQISALRKILGEKKDAHEFIVTIPGKGYKFIAADKPTPGTRSADVREEIIGRAADIAEITSILRREGRRLLTLTGAGGSGKTTLARKVADEYREAFEGGVFFVELTAIDQAENFAGAIAQAVDLKESGDEPLLEALKLHFRNRRTLIILDNFEQLLSAGPIVKELLDATANLQILVTSRAPLHLKGEREKAVAPLAVPPKNSILSVEEMSGFASIELFSIRAREAKAGFVLNDENAPVVAEICNRLDGLPLAIELAAARVKLLSPQAISERLENALKLLTGGAQELPERQRTMRDTLRWSYDLLADEERRRFLLLAVFAGGFTVEAAETVCEKFEAGAGRSEVLDTLTALIDCSLLVSKERQDGSVRLSMLEVVREFALELLASVEDARRLRHIHAGYFLALAEKAETFLEGETGSAWLEKLENEHDNLRSALDWSLTNEPETAARIAAALRFFWLNRSHLSEGLRWTATALKTTEDTLSETRCKLLMSNGLFLKNHGDLEAARASYEKCWAERKELKDPLYVMKVSQGLAAVAVLQHDYEAAQGFLAEALTLSREAGDEVQNANILCAYGDLEMCRGNFLAARPLLEECLMLSTSLQDARLLTTVYFNLGTIDHLEGSYDTAANNFAESLRIAVQMGSKTMIACALDGFAALAVVSCDHELAARLAGAAESLREKIGYRLEPAEESFRKNYLGQARAALGDSFESLYTQGREMSMEEAVELARE